MWNARRNGRWFGWGCLFLSCSILLFRSAAVLRKNHFSEGKVLLQRAAAQAEQLSVDVMMPLLFYDGKAQDPMQENTESRKTEAAFQKEKPTKEKEALALRLFEEARKNLCWLYPELGEAILFFQHQPSDRTKATYFLKWAPYSSFASEGID